MTGKIEICFGLIGIFQKQQIKMWKFEMTETEAATEEMRGAPRNTISLNSSLRHAS